jgi:hypothetical protein
MRLNGWDVSPSLMPDTGAHLAQASPEVGRTPLPSTAAGAAGSAATMLCAPLEAAVVAEPTPSYPAPAPQGVTGDNSAPAPNQSAVASVLSEGVPPPSVAPSLPVSSLPTSSAGVGASSTSSVVQRVDSVGIMAAARQQVDGLAPRVRCVPHCVNSFSSVVRRFSPQQTYMSGCWVVWRFITNKYVNKRCAGWRCARCAARARRNRTPFSHGCFAAVWKSCRTSPQTMTAWAQLPRASPS